MRNLRSTFISLGRSLAVALSISVFTSTPAAAEIYGDWFGIYGPDLCMISTEDVSDNGASLVFMVRGGVPTKVAYISNDNWNERPPLSWSSQGMSDARVRFSRMGEDSYLAFRANDRIVFGNTNEQATFGLLTINLLAESAWSGNVQFFAINGTVLGEFSADGFSEAQSKYSECTSLLN